MADRNARILRETSETRVEVVLGLDAEPRARVATTIPFLDHMLTLMARHGMLALEIDARGDTEIDLHHTVEDVGITLGQAFREALGGREGIRRYGQGWVPMDEALASAHVDLCTRPYLVYRVPRMPGSGGGFDTDLGEQFFRAFASSMQATLHLSLHYGTNQHHALEALFKAAGRAMGEAVQPDPRIRGPLSTKGCL